MYGTDIKVAPNMEISTSASGEALLTDDEETVCQDIFLRLSTYYGSLFYDSEYGSYIYDYIQEEDSDETRFALCDEVVRRTESDPRVAQGSASASISAWDLQVITISLRFNMIDSDNVFNLVLSLDKKTNAMVLL